MIETILLKRGVLLVHNHEDKVDVVKADLLIQRGRIAAIADIISPEPGTRVIDCAHKIIAPGFIDTHHHLWQTQLKGQHANDTLLNYMAKSNLQASNFTPKDAFWGQLGGCLEALDAGTTTVVDHAHINVSREHSEMAVTATASSGIRSIFCYCPYMKVEPGDNLRPNSDPLGGHAMATLRKLAQDAPFGDGRVQLGFAFDLWSMPHETITSLFAEVKSLGVKLITSHYTQMRKPHAESFAQKAKTCGVLDSSLLWSHANFATTDELRLIADSGATISSTASTELQMGHGIPIAYEERMQSMRSRMGVGIDCHSCSQSSIPAELRLGLQAVRAFRNQGYVDQALPPPDIRPSVEEAYNLGTIYGARAAGIDQDTGSIQVGKRADLLIFDARSPAMICGAQLDPVATIVLHSSPSDIECVIVDGIVRKEKRELLVSELGDLASTFLGKASVTWGEVADALVESRERLQGKNVGIDYGEAQRALILGLRPSTTHS